MATTPDEWAQLIEAAARATLLSNKRARRDSGLVASYAKDPFVVSKRKLRINISYSAIRQRISKGHLDIVGPWNGDFVLGLKISGALKEHSRPYDYKMYISSYFREKFDKALEEEPFAFLRYDDRYISSPLLSWYPPETGNSPSVIAGMLAGAIMQKDALQLRTSDLAVNLLKKWTIVHGEKGCLLEVPLFYGVLFSSWMPEAFQWLGYSEEARLANAKYAVCYWTLVNRRKRASVLPSANALPLGSSKATLREQGYWGKDLFKESRDLGLYPVYTGLYEVLREWEGQYRRNPRASIQAIVEGIYSSHFS